MSHPILSTASPAEVRDADADETQVDTTPLVGVFCRYVALLVAWIATSGSLFFSEVLGWIPCSLCWYQRILMYPLSVIIAVGLLRRDTRLHFYVLPLSLVGAVVSLYHYLLQKTTWLPPPACAIGVPCTVDYINWFGFVTIPFLALTAFLIISVMMLASWLAGDNTPDEDAANSSPLARFGYDRLAVFGIIAIIISGFVAAARFI